MDESGQTLTYTLTRFASMRKSLIINSWRLGELNPLRPLQPRQMMLWLRVNLILRIIEWGLLGLVLSQILTQNWVQKSA
jgi:hypothetical protein